MPQSVKNYSSGDCLQDRLNRIYGFNRSDIASTDLRSPYIELLNRLGNPHLHLPPTIHIAGTNGKGSTLAFIRSIYEAEGYIVHAYTSPHLIQFNERIVIGGQMITDSVLLDYMDMVDAAKGDLQIGFSEYITALAFKVFVDHPADLCLLETGLGGRLDPTNIIPSPYATVITPIGYDHMDYLGHTIKDIAAEKAGIIKPHTPCIIAQQLYPDIMPIFETKSDANHAKLYRADVKRDLPPLGLHGGHQRINASTALTVIDILKNHFPVGDMAQINGLQNCRWPARMEHITRGKIHDILPQTCELWFDGGHNTEGAQTIAQQLYQWKTHQHKNIHIIIGMNASKDAYGFVSKFINHATTVTCIDLPQARPAQSGAMLKQSIIKHIESSATPIHSSTDIQSAIQALSLDQDDIILICGSLYLYEKLW